MGAKVLKSNKSYTKMRDFLRLIFINGCYSKKALKKYNIITDKQYRDYTDLLMEYFDENNHNIRQYSRDSLKMNFEYYETLENYLVDSYLTKSSSSNFMSIYFLVLQMLIRNGKPLKRKEITEEIYRIYGFDEESKVNCSKDLSENSIYKYLKELVSLDILKENEDNEFFINNDIFESLSDEELINLYDAVSFFANALVPSTPGYYLKHTLERYIKHIRKLEKPNNKLFLHRFVPLHSVLDDEIVINLLNSIKLNKRIEIEYHRLISKDYCYTYKSFKFIVCPVKIIFDLNLGRWYLASFDENNHLSIFRIDKIHKIRSLVDSFDYEKAEKYFNDKFKKVWTASIPFSAKGDTEVKLEIQGNKEYILEMILEEVKYHQLILGHNGNYYLTIKVTDEVELIPWIRCLSPHVKILESSSLKNRFVNDLLEMKKNYELV